MAISPESATKQGKSREFRVCEDLVKIVRAKSARKSEGNSSEDTVNKSHALL